MSDIFQDSRFKWIRQKVVLALEMPTTSFDDYFTDTLERARSAGKAREQMKDYFSANHCTGSALFFSCIKSTEEIEGMFDLVLLFFCISIILVNVE